MMVYSYVQWKAVFVGGSNRDLVQIAPGYSMYCKAARAEERHFIPPDEDITAVISLTNPVKGRRLKRSPTVF